MLGSGPEGGKSSHAVLQVVHINNESNSLDYALVEVEEASHMVPNVLPKNQDLSQAMICDHIGAMGATKRQVLAITSRVIIPGALDMAASYVLTPGSKSFCAARFARFEQPLEEGDSGSWVVDALRGDVYGHIVAGSPEQGLAVVVPFDAIFADIKASLKASPQLPTAKSEVDGGNQATKLAQPSTLASDTSVEPQPVTHWTMAGHALASKPLSDDPKDGKTRSHARMVSSSDLIRQPASHSTEEASQPEAHVDENTAILLYSTPSSHRETDLQSSFKKHKCPYCGTEFSRHHNLKSHLFTHSQEKPYRCQQCKLSFRRMHDLKRHGRSHTGEKGHVCPKCGRLFARGDALARHTKGAGECAGSRPDAFIDGDGDDMYGASQTKSDALAMTGIVYEGMASISHESKGGMDNT